MAADTRAAQCAHCNLDLSTREPGQAEIAENYGVSQPTISRAISAINLLLVQALLGYVPTADELGVGTCYIVDGTPLPCWSWRAHPELYSGKRQTTGMNVRVACTITGCLQGSPTRSLEAAMITIALENPACSSRPARATGSAIKDTSATTCARPSGSLTAANYWIGRRSSISISVLCARLSAVMSWRRPDWGARRGVSRRLRPCPAR